MFYLTQMLGKPVVDAAGETIGAISDVAIATGEVFPRVTSLAFLGPDKTPFMLSWRKYVAAIDDDKVTLNAVRDDLRFSYLQRDEVLLARDLLNKQIVDTQGMKVVRVNDLKLSESRNQLRLLGAEVGIRGILRGIHPTLERIAERFARLFGRELPEDIIPWNYMDLLERDLSHVKLSVSHKRLHELHPADIADVLEQLSPAQRAKVFEHLDNAQAAEAISELAEEFQADVIDDLSNQRASDILGQMDPDDAADIIGDLPYDKAETLLRLMGVNEARAIRSLLGYREKSAGGIMTPEVTTVSEDMTVQEVIDHIRREAAENESIYYIYVVDAEGMLTGVVSLRDLLISPPDTRVSAIAQGEVFTVSPDDDQETVAEMMGKYDLLALPVVDETGHILGVVTVDDALEVLEEESAEDLELATGRRAGGGITGVWQWLSRNGWLFVWTALFAAAIVVGSSTAVLFALGATIVLRITEDIASHALSRLIETDEPAPLRRHLAKDALSGLVLGSTVGLAMGGAAWLARETALAPVALDDPVLQLEVSVAIGIVYALTIVTVSVGGALLVHLGSRLARGGRHVSGTALTMWLLISSLVAFGGLAYLASAVLRMAGTPAA